MASFQQATDLEMILSTEEEVREVGPAQKPQRYFLKSLVGAALLGGLALCGSQAFGHANTKAPTEPFGQTIELADVGLATVQKVYGAWGTGKFHGDGCEENAKEFYTEDTIVDVRAPAVNTGLFKEYKGLKGLCEWIAKFEVYNFSTLKFEQLYAAQGDKVMAIVTYVPTLVSGKKGKDNVEDGQIFTVTDGKVSHAAVWFAGIAALDGLLGDKKFEPEAGDGMKVMEDMMMDFGKGKFAGDDCLDTAKKFFHEKLVFGKGKFAGYDCLEKKLVAEGRSKDTTYEKSWEGPEGYCKRIQKTGPKMAKMNNFKTPVMYERAPGQVLVKNVFELEGKRHVDFHLWKIDDGMITEHNMVSDDRELFD
jgi:hypothetical protein